MVDVTYFSAKSDFFGSTHKPAPGRALDAARRRDARVHRHHGGPDGLDELVDRHRRAEPAEQRGEPHREEAALPRRQLRPARLAGSRADACQTERSPRAMSLTPPPCASPAAPRPAADSTTGSPSRATTSTRCCDSNPRVQVPSRTADLSGERLTRRDERPHTCPYCERGTTQSGGILGLSNAVGLLPRADRTRQRTGHLVSVLTRRTGRVSVRQVCWTARQMTRDDVKRFTARDWAAVRDADAAYWAAEYERCGPIRPP